MEEQTKSTKTMKIVLFVVIGLVLVVGVLSALFYTPNGECVSNQMIEGDAPDMTEDSSLVTDTKEAAPF